MEGVHADGATFSSAGWPAMASSVLAFRDSGRQGELRHRRPWYRGDRSTTGSQY
jgi:hypothetical protein